MCSFLALSRCVACAYELSLQCRDNLLRASGIEIAPLLQGMLGASNGSGKFGFENVTVRQLREVFGNSDCSLLKFQQFNLLVVPFSAENQSQRRLFCLLISFVLVQPAQIQLHLSLVSGIEPPQL